jgi:hypothetical protein
MDDAASSGLTDSNETLNAPLERVEGAFLETSRGCQRHASLRGRSGSDRTNPRCSSRYPVRRAGHPDLVSRDFQLTLKIRWHAAIRGASA